MGRSGYWACEIMLSKFRSWRGSPSVSGLLLYIFHEGEHVGSVFMLFSHYNINVKL